MEEGFSNRRSSAMMNFNDQTDHVMLSAGKHLVTHGGRPFAALRVTCYSRSCLLKLIIAPLRNLRSPTKVYLKMLRGRYADTIQLGASTISLIFKSTAAPHRQ
jgi:hypothetical protein